MLGLDLLTKNIICFVFNSFKYCSLIVSVFHFTLPYFTPLKHLLVLLFLAVREHYHVA